MPVELPDLDWYVDHVVVPAGPPGMAVGPVRSWRASWAAEAASLRRAVGDDSRGRATRRALGQGFVLTRGQARRDGLTDAEVRCLVRAGTWCIPHYGLLAVLAPGDDRRRHVLAACAGALVRPGHVISAMSAAVVHGVPLLHDPTRVVLTARDPSRMGGRGGVLVRCAALPDSDVTSWHGAPVTSLARTVIDLARADRAAGLVAADAALHEQLMGRDELVRVAEACQGWPGARSAREIAVLASPLAESPLESLARLCISDAGLPPPQLQAWVEGPDWRYRVDMLWRERRVVVEVDGRVKYTRDELWREKRRQERLERCGFRVVRVLWEDLVRRPAETIERIRYALFDAPRPR